MFISTLGLPITITWIVTLFAGLLLVNQRPKLKAPWIAVLVAIPVLAIIFGYLFQ
jgi:hypothetical protein